MERVDYMNKYQNASNWIVKGTEVEMYNSKSDSLNVYINCSNKVPHRYLHFEAYGAFKEDESATITPPENQRELLVTFTGRKEGNVEATMQYIFYNDAGEKKHVRRIKFGETGVIHIPVWTNKIKMALRVSGQGMISIEDLELRWIANYKEYEQLVIPKRMNLSNTEERYLVLTNIYPNAENLYRNGFVHRRVKSYQEDQLPVDVFAFQGSSLLNEYEFDGVRVFEGNQTSLEYFLKHTNYKKILIHFINRNMYEAIEIGAPNTPVLVWIHAVEAERWTRRLFNVENNGMMARTIRTLPSNNNRRMKFIHELFSRQDDRYQFIFISEFIANVAQEDAGFQLADDRYRVIHNITDDSVFKFEKKDTELRKKIWTVRPFVNKKYGNDLTVKAILELSKRPLFDDLDFEIYGMGPQFDELLEPLRQFKNVHIHERFLSQPEIAEIHRNKGIFLCPTRWDTQGVSMCEAMSSGVIAATNAVSCIPEFMREDTGILAGEEDYIGIADGIEELYNNPELFLEKSKVGSDWIIQKTGKNTVIPEELEEIRKA